MLSRSLYKSGFEYKMSLPFDERKRQSTKLLQLHPTKKPLIIEKSYVSQMQVMSKSKFLMSNNMTVGNIIQTIRSHLKLNEKEALFIFVGNNVTPNLGMSIEELYNKYADKDGFLYISYCSENCFGNANY